MRCIAFRYNRLQAKNSTEREAKDPYNRCSEQRRTKCPFSNGKNPNKMITYPEECVTAQIEICVCWMKATKKRFFLTYFSIVNCNKRNLSTGFKKWKCERNDSGKICSYQISPSIQMVFKMFDVLENVCDGLRICSHKTIETIVNLTERKKKRQPAIEWERIGNCVCEHFCLSLFLSFAIKWELDVDVK